MPVAILSSLQCLSGFFGSLFLSPARFQHDDSSSITSLWPICISCFGFAATDPHIGHTVFRCDGSVQKKKISVTAVLFHPIPFLAWKEHSTLLQLLWTCWQNDPCKMGPPIYLSWSNEVFSMSSWMCDPLENIDGIMGWHALDKPENINSLLNMY